MGKKRANNEGSISLRKDGRWLIQLQIGIKEDGKPKKVYKYAKTQVEAVKILDQLKRDLWLGIDASKGNFTVSEWIIKWMDEFKRNLKPSTRTSYITNKRVHIDKYIGGVKLNKLKREQIQYMLDNIYNNGKTSISLVIKVYNILSGALEQAVKQGIFAKNPAKNVVLPHGDDRRLRVFSIQEQKDFIKELDNEESRTLFLTYLNTGARLGEIPALTWKDIDFQNRIIDINKKVMVVHDYYAKDKKTVQQVQNYCKTLSSIRKVVIPVFLVDILKEHKEKQIAAINDSGIEWSESNLVFPTINGTIPYTRNIQEKYTRIVNKIGITGTSIHTLRHTYATRLFEADVDVKTISEQLGHKSIKTTYDIYIHVIPQKKLKEIDKLEKLNIMAL